MMHSDIQMAKAPNQSHAIHLPRLFLETADGQHGPIGGKLLLLAEVSHGFGVGALNFLGDRHAHSLRKRPAIVTGHR